MAGPESDAEYLMAEWTVADRVSDRIVDVVNAELAAMRAAGTLAPLQLLAGQLLALMALHKTMPPPARQPPEILDLYTEIARCLQAIVRHERRASP